MTQDVKLRVELFGPDWLEQSAVEWGNLLNDSDAHPVFMSWAWMQSWWETFGSDRHLRIVACFDGGRLVAIAPFCQDARWGRGPGGRLELVGQQVAGADYLDIVCRRTHAEAVVRALAEWLTSEASFSWHRAAFDGVMKGAIIGRLVQRLAGKCRVRESVSSICPVLAVQGEWAAFLRARFDRKRRYNIERQARIALVDSGLSAAFSTDPGPVLRGLDDVFALHRLRKNQQEMATSFTGDQVLAFHRRLVTRLAPDGKVLVATLTRNKGPVAAAYCFVGGGSISYFQSGFDPAYEQLGVGSVLLFEVLRYAFGKNLREFDFLRGDEAYKYTWASESRPLYRSELFRQTPAGYGFFACHKVVAFGRALVRRVRWTGHQSAPAVRRRKVDGVASSGGM